MQPKIGDTRTTADGSIETCIDVQGEIVVWALTIPSQAYIDNQAAQAVALQQQKDNQTTLDQIHTNRLAFIDALISGDTSSQAALKTVQAPLVATAIAAGVLDTPAQVAADAGADQKV